MHNLFLGTAHRILDCVWLNSEPPRITKSQIQKIQKTIDATPLPSDMGTNFIQSSIQFFHPLFLINGTWTLIFSIQCNKICSL